MTTLLFDGSFTGLLTAIFEAYEYKWVDVHLATIYNNSNLFGARKEITTDPAKAQRVWDGLLRYIPKAARQSLYNAFLSEAATMPQTLFTYIQYVFTSKTNISNNYSHPAVIAVQQANGKVHREKHRMEAFVRFSLTKDHLYYAVVEPDFNVLPLISEHFEKRYADQLWLIYDARRKYGIYYDLTMVAPVEIDLNKNIGHGSISDTVHDGKEAAFQQLWQQYFSSVNIAARKNTALHLRHMPLRYWKYLPEKKASITGMAG